jgi:alpha-galactosidase
VNQDALGRAAGRIWKDGRIEIWARPLSDGTVAAGLFNRGLVARPVSLRWSDLNLQGRLHVRDLWKRQDLGSFDGAFTATVPSHGVVFVKIGRPRSRD